VCDATGDATKDFCPVKNSSNLYKGKTRLNNQTGLLLQLNFFIKI